MPLHVSSTCSHHREVKIALHSLWYHHTYRWPSRSPVHETVCLSDVNKITVLTSVSVYATVPVLGSLKVKFFIFKTLPVVFLVLNTTPKFCFLKNFLKWDWFTPIGICCPLILCSHVDAMHGCVSVIWNIFCNTGTFCVTPELTGIFSVI